MATQLIICQQTTPNSASLSCNFVRNGRIAKNCWLTNFPPALASVPSSVCWWPGTFSSVGQTGNSVRIRNGPRRCDCELCEIVVTGV